MSEGPDSLRALADWFIRNYPYNNTAVAIRDHADVWEAERAATEAYEDETLFEGWPLSRFLFEATQLHVPEWVWKKAKAQEARIEALERALCGDDTERERLRSLWGLPALAAGEG